MKNTIGFVIAAALATGVAWTSDPAGCLVYFGTYTGAAGGKGIYVSRMTADGALSVPEVAAEVSNPSFLALHPNRRFLYAVSEVPGSAGRSGGAVSAFSIDAKTARLTLLNTAPSGGPGPCYVAIDPKGRNALVANYSGGSVGVIPLRQDGSLANMSAFIQHEGSGTDKRRQQGPHAHSINVSPDGRFAVAADLGLDKLLVYALDIAQGRLTPNDPPYASVRGGAGPRHFAFHPRGRFAYVINEMQSTVTAFAYDAARGVLKEIQTLTSLPAGYSGDNTTAEIQVHPGGKFLYGSNRGHDSIAVFAIDSASGTLTPVEHVSTMGKVPRNFGIDPGGLFLLAANQKTNSVVVFRIDRKTGRLTATGQMIEVPFPVCVKFRAE